MPAENQTNAGSSDGLTPTSRSAKTPVSTCIVWGIGDTGKKLAALLDQSGEAHDAVASSIQAYEQEGESLTALRNLISRVAETARIKGGEVELEVRIILACWEPDDRDIIDLLRSVSKTLDITLAIERTLTLTLILPPPTASEAQLERVFSMFLSLEGVLGELAFLNAVFVYQLPLEVFDGELAESDATQDLVELMSREFTVPVVLESIHQRVYPVLRLNQQTAGRDAVYSALGAQQLSFSRTELLRHLEARFQFDLLSQGLLALDAVSTIVLERTTKLADDGVTDIKRVIDPYRNTRPRSQSRMSLLADVGKPNAMTVPDFEHKLDGALRTIREELAPLFAELQTRQKQAFDDVLSLQGQNIACAGHFLELVEGHAAEEKMGGERVSASGLFDVAQSFMIAPFMKTSIAFIRQASENLAAASEISLSTADPGTGPVSRLDAYIEALQAAFTDTDFKSRYLVQALNTTWSQFKYFGQQAWCGEAEACELMRAVFTAYSEQFQQLAQSLRENEHNLQQNEKQRLALARVYPWYKRLFNMPAAYRAEKDNLLTLRDQLQKERELLRHTRAEFEVLLRSLVDEILWPQLLPALIMEDVRNRVSDMKSELKGFADQLRSACAQQWASAENMTEVDRLTRTTVLDRDKCEQLYRQQLGSRSWGEYAQKTLVFEPLQQSRELKDKTVYADCKNLRDHFYAGHEVLLVRMADHAAAFFMPVQSMEVMDIIHVGGVEQARAFLLRVLSKAEYLPEFSTGMLPRAQERGSMKRFRVIRCSAHNREKLLEGFSELLDENDRFVPIDSPVIIDITTLRHGFPAFVLHVLNNARQQILDNEGVLQQDLWPI